LDDSVIKVGKKGVMAYVGAGLMMLSKGVKHLEIQARGRAISKACDIAEILRSRFNYNLEYENVEISTQEITPKDRAGTMNISCMEICLVKRD